MNRSSEYLVLGIMSGTSLDGVDMALCKYRTRNSKWDFKIIDGITFPYPDEIRQKLEECIHYTDPEIASLDSELGKFFASKANEFLGRLDQKPDLISCHGHTVFHKPDKGLTLQIGRGDLLSRLTGITVVNDFRSYDVSIGGQGAPLVPVGDRDLFSNYDMCLNLGGFANISYSERSSGNRVACDISPCNMALNELSRKVGKAYDQDGKIAGSGTIDHQLLSALNSLEYYALPAPKSLGKEWYLDSFLPFLNDSAIETRDKLATVTDHIAFQVSSFISESGLSRPRVLVSGGGAYNRYLIRKISGLCDAEIVIPTKSLLEFKEALIFGYLGILKIRGEINILSSVTGSANDSCSGMIYYPK